MTVLIPRDRKYSRYLFDWSARWALERSSLDAITGQAATFGRAGLGSVLGGDGRLYNAGQAQPRFEWIDLDGDGVRETPLLVLEDTGGNLCLQSENFGTTWSAIGTPTRTAGAHTTSGVSLDLIGDDAAGTLEGYSQNITFTGNAVKAWSVYVKQGTSTSSVIRHRDTTANADRVLAVITWSGGLPSVAMTTGTYLGYKAMADGVFRLLFVSTSATAANTNQVQVYPATTSALATSGTGTIYAGGVQAENNPFPTSYSKTTTGTVSRAAESLSFPFMALPAALTIYASFVEYGTLSTGVTSGLLGIGASTNPALSIESTPGVYAMLHRRSSNVLSSLGAAPSFGQLTELRGLLNADGSVQIGQSINGAAETTGTASAANALAAAWNDTTLTINSRGTGTAGYTAIQCVRIAAGSQTLAYMRAG